MRMTVLGYKDLIMHRKLVEVKKTVNLGKVNKKQAAGVKQRLMHFDSHLLSTVANTLSFNH